jgi:Co/Zn/Cd efflux system component
MMSNCGCGSDQTENLERKTLLALLAINAVMFFTEITLGFLAESTGLIADSLDMLADAGVYGLSLFVVGKGIERQSRAASISGVLQIILGIGVIVEVTRRLLFGSEPESLLIIAVGTAALMANIYCLFLLSRHREAGVHMRASWIFSTNDVIANFGVIISGFSTNDVIANFGVIISGVLVLALDNRYPDLVIGAIISAVVIRGGLKILHEAKEANKMRVEA